MCGFPFGYERASFLFLERSLDGQQRFLERRQIVFHGVPDNLAVNPLILMSQDVANAGYVLPAHILMLRLKLAAEMTASFGNHFDATLDSGSQNPGTFEISERFCDVNFFYCP